MDGDIRRVTIKDVAAHARVSVSTVHLVLSGKSGPKPDTRNKVLRVAEELNYQPNSIAASLKRGVLRIAVILPALTDINMFYYSPIWEGVRGYMEVVKDYNVEFIEIPYVNDIDKFSVAVPVEAVKQAENEKGIAGVIALGDIEPEAKRALRLMSDNGVSIVLVNSDAPEIGRLCCVQAHNKIIGSMMGEILYRQTPKGSGILVCAGDENTPSNYESVEGLESYLSAHDPGRPVYKIYRNNDMSYLYERLLYSFSRYDDISGCCSVTARGSIQLARALKSSGKAVFVPAIGSDVFGMNINSLKEGVFINLINKNPYMQAWTAAEKLLNYLIRDMIPEESMIYVGSEAVFQSSIPMYEDRLKADMHDNTIVLN